MDAVTAPSVKTARINRFLPYWAVFQADMRQTLRSWIYRLWVLLSFGAAVGYLLYRFGAKQTGIVQPASLMMSDLLRWYVLGSITLIIVLTAGTICSERGTMADSVLSRGISRYQYFLGKWHARLAVVLTTFFILALGGLIGGYFLLHGDNLSILGSLVALIMVGSLLVVVVTCGVTISALTNSSVVSVAVLWVLLSGGGFFLSLLSDKYPSPERALRVLPQMLEGWYDTVMVNQMILWSLGFSFVLSLVGMISFGRRDV
jgi:ABC-type transport system involved in multi-copper enzyme maturation permease subunit